MLFHEREGSYEWEKSAFEMFFVKLCSELWLGTFSEVSFSLLADYMSVFHPLLIQLVISWAGSSNNLYSFTLFFIQMCCSTYSKTCEHL